MEIQSLKINQEISDIKEQLNGLLDLFYPVGSYYETSDITFYPSVVWGGTWKQDTKGYVTVGALTDGGDSPREGGLDIDGGVTKGEVEHTLTVEEIPSHAHAQYAVANLNSGGPGIRGTFNDTEGPGQSRYSTGTETGEKGGGQPHNNIQPSIGVYRWHRIA